jgi:hypothetical protein
MSIDAMKQALHTLEGWANHGEWVWPESALEQAKRNTTESITALRAAIEQAQKPVAWQVMVEDEAMKEFPIKDMAHDWCAKKKLSGSPSAYWIRPLYTAPRQWQGLTDDEREQFRRWAHPDMIEAIELRLQERNT